MSKRFVLFLVYIFSFNLYAAKLGPGEILCQGTETTDSSHPCYGECRGAVLKDGVVQRVLPMVSPYIPCHKSYSNRQAIEAKNSDSCSSEQRKKIRQKYVGSADMLKQTYEIRAREKRSSTGKTLSQEDRVDIATDLQKALILNDSEHKKELAQTGC